VDLQDFVASLSDEQIPAVLDDLFRRRAGIEHGIGALLREVERRRIYRHRPGHHNGALRGRAVRLASNVRSSGGGGAL
jgi:hypothetical protein